MSCAGALLPVDDDMDPDDLPLAGLTKDERWVCVLAISNRECQEAQERWTGLGDVVIFEYNFKGICLPRQGRIIELLGRKVLQLPGWLVGGEAVELAPARVRIASPIGRFGPACLFDLAQWRRFHPSARIIEREEITTEGIKVGCRPFVRPLEGVCSVGGPEDPVEVYW